MTHEQLYYFPEDTIRENRILIRMAVLAAACHLVLFTAVVFTPKLGTRPNFMPKAVKVDLVTLPTPKPQGAVPSKAVQKPPIASALPEKTAPKPEPRPKKSTKTTVSKKVPLTKKSLSIKKSLKARTYKSDKAIETAIEQIKKELPRSRSREVVAAINKLKEQVAAQEEGVVKGAAGKARNLELLDIYNAEIWHQIQKQWAFSNQLAQGRTNLEAIIIAKIMKDGQIRDLWFEERSGNNFFDDSVFRAIKKASPLPPLPEGYPSPYYEVGFRFNLSELQKSLSQ
ncbi:MAG: TonB family protein [Pseudomonadota bacterium]